MEIMLQLDAQGRIGISEAGRDTESQRREDAGYFGSGNS